MPLCFQSFEKWANLRFPLNVQKPKMLQLQGALPLDPARDSAPRTRYRLALPRSPWRHAQILWARTATAMSYEVFRLGKELLH